MKYLYDNKYYTATLYELEQFISGKATLPKRTVVITFDDGYISFYDKAWDVLRQYGFPATVFVVAGLSGGTDGYINWEQMRFLEANWIDVGSHSSTHTALRSNDQNALEREISDSKRMVEENLVYPCSFFCYPEGYYTDKAVAAVKEAGYIAAVTIRSGNATQKNDLFKLPRLYVRRGVTPERLYQILVTGIT
jgi:peptidoglycan/xylan/chitin deacetylase (PgdA/CDA1 family)